MRKYKFLACICIAVIAFGSLLGCSSDVEKKELPKIVIGYGTHEPYCYTDEDGEPAGLDIEIAKEVCKRIGYEPVFKSIDWGQRDILLESGKIDCLWSCVPLDRDQEKYSWAGPYMYTRQVVAVLKDSPIKHLEDLEGKTVSVKVDNMAEKLFLERKSKKIPKVKTVYSLNSSKEAVTALRNDYVDACAGYSESIQKALDLDGIEYRFLDEDLTSAELGVAFYKNHNEKLRVLIDSAIKKMHTDGVIRDILLDYGLDADKALGVTH